jgi:hypothetical protein
VEHILTEAHKEPNKTVGHSWIFWMMRSVALLVVYHIAALKHKFPKLEYIDCIKHNNKYFK